MDRRGFYADLRNHGFADGLGRKNLSTTFEISDTNNLRMSVLYIALPIAILLGAAGLWACLQCIKTGQYEDLEADSYRILLDDQPDLTKQEHKSP
jgi:cbb3-type cytochrome oxidase maturation protein